MLTNDMKDTIARETGILVISLDFELWWGPLLKNSYEENIKGSREVVKEVLRLFDRYGIHATWATVGFLFYDNKEELLNSLPKMLPKYEDSEHSPFDYLKIIGRNEEEDPYHYAPTIIRGILSYENQEIGTHTFSHYCCLEEGHDLASFREDLEAVHRAAKKHGIEIGSIVFPKNQYNKEHLAICREMGLVAYRGNQGCWIYKARSGHEQSLAVRALRFADAFVNITGHNATSIKDIEKEIPYDIRASRFTYCYRPRLGFLDALRKTRIIKDIRYAARQGLVYHLWFHPHNFGVNTEKNLQFLEDILKEYNSLEKEYGMKSMNMSELASIIARKGNEYQ